MKPPPSYIFRWKSGGHDDSAISKPQNNHTTKKNVAATQAPTSINSWFCCDYLPKGPFSLLLSDVITSTRHLRQTKTRPPTSDDIATVAMRSQAKNYLPPCGGCRIQVGKGCHMQRNFFGVNLLRGPTEDLFSYIVQNGKRRTPEWVFTAF